MNNSWIELVVCDFSKQFLRMNLFDGMALSSSDEHVVLPFLYFEPFFVTACNNVPDSVLIYILAPFPSQALHHFFKWNIATRLYG